MIKMAINTLEKITQENGVFYDKVLLKRLTGNLHFAKYGQKRNIPGNNGTEIDMRRFNSLAPATTPLTEGVTPEGDEYTVTQVRATVKQYGKFVTISDVLDMAGLDKNITEVAEVLGEQAAETIDNIIKEEIFAGTTVQYANGAAGRDAVSGVLTGDEVMKAVRTLRANKAKPVADGYYIGFIDPYCAYDLMKDPLWQDVSKYSNKENIEKGEIGKLHGVKFIDNTNAFTAGKVHGTLIIGRDAYGIVDIEGSRKPKIIIHTAKEGGSADPLEQRNTVAWKVFFTAKRLQELAMVRIETAVTE
jgi:N4-gp56 family major capsid protein